MQARIFDIVSREKLLPFNIPGPDDFTLMEKGVIDGQKILADPNISLYCLEPQNQQAVFVKTPESANILAAPFFYIGQYEYAVQVLKVSYETLEKLADQVVLDDRRLILIYSMGRSGTTVTSSAFGQAKDTVSISEPDVFTQLVHMRDFSGANADEISALTRACLLLICKDRGKGHQPVWVLKFRSFVMELADLIYAQFPQAKSLFLYRHLDPWGKSTARAFGGDQAPSQEQMYGFWMWNKPLNQKIDCFPLSHPAEINAGLLISASWLNYMERCLERLDAGQPILPVRYEDLKSNPNIVIQKIFEYCGVAAADMNKLNEVLGKDSQANSTISRDQLKQVEWEISPEDIAIGQRIIANNPIINTPDYRLPGTLELE